MKKILLISFLVAPFFAKSQDVITVAGTGTGGYMGDNASAISAELNSPDAVKFDASGNMYIADEYNHVIRKVNTSGIITTIAGTGTGGHTGDNGPATNAELRRPGDLVFDEDGNLYVSEYGNEDIRKISVTGIITTIAGTGVAGYNGDSILATAAQLNDPNGLAFDKAGNLCFSDMVNYRIRRINMSTGIIYTIAGTGIGGYAGDNGPATAAEIRLVGYMTYNSSGELYIPDYNNYVVRKIDTVGVITTIAGTGTMGYTGDGGSATDAEFTSACSVIFDPFGNMYLSDRVLGVIRKIDATTNVITTIAGTGTTGYGGDGGPAIAAQFNTDVNCSAIDAAGNLYVADPLNNRVRKITYHDTTTIDTTNHTGIHSAVSAGNVVSVYPDPAKDKLTIKSSYKIESIIIVNEEGREVPFGKLTMTGEREVLLNISYLPSGVYFVKVNGVYGGKFVKE